MRCSSPSNRAVSDASIRTVARSLQAFRFGRGHGSPIEENDIRGSVGSPVVGTIPWSMRIRPNRGGATTLSSRECFSIPGGNVASNGGSGTRGQRVRRERSGAPPHGHGPVRSCGRRCRPSDADGSGARFGIVDPRPRRSLHPLDRPDGPTDDAVGSMVFPSKASPPTREPIQSMTFASPTDVGIPDGEPTSEGR